MMKSKCSLHSECNAVGSTPEFFTIFVPRTNSHRLRIPQVFDGHLRGIVPRTFVTIRNSGNNMWIVRLEMQDGDYFFTCGWNEFVNDQTLELGDFLVFRFEGDSTFFVRSYGRTCCTKDSNFAQEDLNNHHLDHMRGLAEAKLSREKGTKQRGVDMKGNEDTVDKSSRSKASVQRLHSFEDQTRPAVFKDIRLKRKRGRPPIVGKGGNGAIAAANKYASNMKYPHIRMGLTRSYLKNKTLHIQKEFTAKYLKKTSTDIYLKVSNRLWEVRICEFGKFYKLQDGFSDFIKDNLLQEGDNCILELIDNSKHILNVSIFRSGPSSR
ncbi:putative B3 domain-containing protein, partial [Drosera capensis]